jgi:hypothetical protein
MISAMGAVGEGKRFRAVTIPKGRQSLRHFIECLIPGEALPLVCATFARSFQGKIEASGVIEVIDKQPAPRAEPSARDGMVGVPLDLDGATVFNAQAHTATRVAETTKRSPGFRHGSCTSVVSSIVKLAVVYR